MNKEEHVISIIKDNITGTIWCLALLNIAVIGTLKVSHKEHVAVH